MGGVSAIEEAQGMRRTPDPLERIDEFAPHDGPKIDLPSVTSIVVHSTDDAYELGRLARIARWHRRFLRFGKEVWFTTGEPPIDGVEWRRIEPYTDHPRQYSHWCVRDLHREIDTTHLMISQWDGFAVCPEQWTDEFLGVDYVGGPTWQGHQWSRRNRPRGAASQDAVGNGGFSIRSRRLHEIASTMLDPEHPMSPWEDFYLCVVLRDRLEGEGLRFASLPLGWRFAQNYHANLPITDRFGFHGHTVLSQAKQVIESRWLR